MYYTLTYHFADNYISARAAHRIQHFDHITKYKATGQFLMGGAFDDQKSALLIFKVDNASVVKEFATTDPYVINKVVTNWECKQWNMVTGDVIPVPEP